MERYQVGRSLVLLALCWVLTLVDTMPASAQGNDYSVRKRFMAEAPAAWERYRAAAPSLQGSNSHIIYEGLEPMGRIREQSRWDFRRSPGGFTRVVQQESSDGVPAERALVTNPRYAFEINKKSADAEWVLVDLQKGFVTKGDLALQERERIHDMGFLVLLRVGDKLLSELVGKEGFQLVAVTALPVNGKEMVKVEFKDQTPRRRHTGVHSQEGWVLLDPQDHWVVKQAQLQVANPGRQSTTVSYENEYQRRGTDITLPIRTLRKSIFKSPNGSSRSECTVSTFDWHFQENVPEYDFSLTAFGMREPYGLEAPRRPTNWFLWGSGFGFLLLILGFLCKRFAMRYRAAA